MTIPAVVDSTCLIALENIGCLHIAEMLLSPALAPPAVQREFGNALSWLTIVAPNDVASLQMVVGPGEAEAIALALEKGMRIILDDRKARGVARRLGLSITGTVGLGGELSVHSPALTAKRNTS